MGESLKAALEECDQLAQLAEDLLVLARAAEDGLPIRQEEISAHRLLQAVRERFSLRAQQQGRGISVEANGDLKVTVDPLRMRQDRDVCLPASSPFLQQSMVTQLGFLRQSLLMEPNQARIDTLRRFSAMAAIAAALIGALAMTGWVLGVDFLKSVVPGLITMKANTALVFILLGVSLHATVVGHGRHKTSVRVATLLGFTLAATVLSQYVHGHDLGVDLLLFHEPQGTVGTIHPGRMALNTSICFVLLGAALLVFTTRYGRVVAPAVGMIVSGAALLALVGYFAGLTNLYGFAKQTQMAVPTAVGMFLLGFGLLASRPDCGSMRLLASDGAGGILVRRILPAAVLGTLVLAILRLAGQAAGLYGTATGAWLLASGFIAMLVPIVWRVGWSIERADAERHAMAKELKRLSERDPLTGLYNRRRLHEEITRQLATLHRHARPFALLMLDLDRFKQVNDTAGHAVGDALLVEVAHALRRQVRTADYVARVGGDEFVILLPELKEGAVEAVATKLLQSLREVRVPCGDTTLTPSASIGAVTCSAPGDKTWTPESILNAADLELYTAKAAGRDGSSHRALPSPNPPPDSIPASPSPVREQAHRPDPPVV